MNDTDTCALFYVAIWAAFIWLNEEHSSSDKPIKRMLKYTYGCGCGCLTDQNASFCLLLLFAESEALVVHFFSWELNNFVGFF